ncbi:MAG: RNA methyltransferase [Methylomonas sp.]|nr:RNA methyltransferase [Methylomonas sp.]PPD21847.1 MAG: tRNA (cytosine(32)/uridine(32)-2'-O)-methyltransferase TrmJ [Methylomonas sp.]PPD27129.1 MAG: tRNA (cytosine(32)/uridine(32)-2'-O)-methyltransferase TrmJ [Methylomonas sp.]PPD39083.1 MAG: tRNA (cytosine(32)/uridine(32)-2'-O)-methyltransferase TrmJ [Methylomonas sp.]PPD42311.1 MAG: tRNA (cytosine(32)/uridine(32)-2'-O)-methyltransferase TrmJ [Methylomonas sp.]
MLSNFKIVLVETSHPGNIGAVARAMKNMALTELRLVSPKLFPHADATARASGADDVLRDAKVYDTLAAAIADCQVVLGTSARDRTISWPVLTARQCAERWVGAADANIALVFGRESSGLANHELDLCHFLLRIPCNPDYSSLNLAAAVQVVCYELFVASGQKHPSGIGDVGEEPLASSEQMEGFYQHLLQTMADIGFLQPGGSVSIMRRLRRLFNRAQLDTKELDILRGILRFSQNHNLK